MKAVTFVVNRSPYLALRTLLKLADDEQSRFPIGAKILRNNRTFMMLWLLFTLSLKGLRSREESINILGSAGFELCRWTSSSTELLNDLAREYLLNEDYLELKENAGNSLEAFH